MLETEPVLLTFLGGAGTVTGSKILVETSRSRVLIDCGLFQGLKQLRNLNWSKLPVDPASIDAVLLTHGHLDHSGYLPLLVKNGFKGPIYATEPTRDITGIILKDSAKIQEEDAENANKYGYTKHHPAKPLYNREDVDATMPLFETHNDFEWVIINNDFKFRFLKSGHILGSVLIELRCMGRKLVFSGDLGRRNPLLMHPPMPVEEADYVIMESTYGDRLHPTVSVYEQLAEVIEDTLARGGNLIVPSFAVERAQELIVLLNEMKAQRMIPPLPVFLDSPMGADVTDLYVKHRDWHTLNDQEAKSLTSHVHIIRDFEQTLTVLDKPGSKIIIAGSGMVTGGRVLYYLENQIEDDRNTVLLAGYQSPGTRGSLMRDGASEIKIHGNYYKVNAKIAGISTLSAHADQEELLGWLKKFKVRPKMVFLNHGELQAADTLKVKIKDSLDIDCEVAAMGVTYELY